MKRPTRIASILIPTSLLAVSLVVLAAQDQDLPGGGTIPYAGVLEQDGVVVSHDGLPMVFRLFTEPTGGSVAWTQSFASVPVYSGEFSVTLGDGQPIAQTLLDNKNLYLEIEINGVLLANRKHVGAVAYSVRSSHADHADLADVATSTNHILAQNIEGNFCLLVRPTEACPGGFTVRGQTDFTHSHTGNNAHNHGIGLDGPSNNAVGCTLDHAGTAGWENIYCTDYPRQGTALTDNTGGGLANAGSGQAWRVCCNY